jgi:hypothetical protein
MAQKSAFTASWSCFDTLAIMLRARWIRQRWRRLVRNVRSKAPHSPGAPADGRHPGDLGSDLSLSGAKAKLETAGKQLASSYQQAFAEIDCG